VKKPEVEILGYTCSAVEASWMYKFSKTTLEADMNIQEINITFSGNKSGVNMPIVCSLKT
jgi:hypothetical protein